MESQLRSYSPQGTPGTAAACCHESEKFFFDIPGAKSGMCSDDRNNKTTTTHCPRFRRTADTRFVNNKRSGLMHIPSKYLFNTRLAGDHENTEINFNLNGEQLLTAHHNEVRDVTCPTGQQGNGHVGPFYLGYEMNVIMYHYVYVNGVIL